MTAPTHYEALGVGTDADFDEIERAYKRLAREVHPDMGGSHEQFAAVQVAYDTLRDYKSRIEYDMTLGVLTGVGAAEASSAPSPTPWGTTEMVPPPPGSPAATAPPQDASTPAPAPAKAARAAKAKRARRGIHPVLAAPLGVAFLAAALGSAWFVKDEKGLLLLWILLVMPAGLGVLIRMARHTSKGVKTKLAFVAMGLFASLPLNFVAGVQVGPDRVGAHFAPLIVVIGSWLAAELFAEAIATGTRAKRVRRGAQQWDYLLAAERATSTTRLWVLETRKRPSGQFILVAEPDGKRYGIDLYSQAVSKKTWVVVDRKDNVQASATDFARTAWLHLYMGEPAPR